MFLSVADIFKIGIGPSSSHTNGPMLAAGRFLTCINSRPYDETTDLRLIVKLHGSLAFTGKGHGTHSAIILGLLGYRPELIDPDAVDAILSNQQEAQTIPLEPGKAVNFNPGEDLIFDYGPPLAAHANGMTFRLIDQNKTVLCEEIYYSIGGGFVLRQDEMNAPDEPLSTLEHPFPFASADEMLAMGKAADMSISAMKRANERALFGKGNIDAELGRIWRAMQNCIERGLTRQGELPGGLNIKRRAAALHAKLQKEKTANLCLPHTVMDWLSVFALAVNEENASGGRIVTAPTNGAAGVIPAVMQYYLQFCTGAKPEDVHDFLLTSAAIGGIIKHNASISGAEVGCQGEVGSASAMAAAGLCAVMGGNNEQVENAAEIALEHHLGMTCDPVGGLVQIPCIERNALGAVKAVTAAALALKGDGSHFISLDKCIETMRRTGADMSENYKETSRGGLAVSGIEC